MEGHSSSSFETLKNKKLKSQKVDRISALPDPIINHILSFLQSTKEAIRTSVLSKRWKNKWCGVPNLIFYSTGMPDELSCVFIDATIIQYGPYNIKKFHMRLDGQNVDNDPHLQEKLHFPVRRQVEELIFEFPNKAIMLPRRCLFHHARLIKLQTLGCILAPSEGVKWEFLKELNMERCRLPDIALEDIFSGSPSLESLRIIICFGFSRLVAKSTSLKKLEFGYLHEISLLEIACPNLEQFNLHGSLDIATVKFTNLSSLIRADLDFEHDGDFLEESLTKKILEQLQHVKELTFGRHVMEVLSYIWYYRPYLSRLSLKITCLTLGSPEFCEFNDGIEYVLLSSPFLERLVITKDFFYEDDFHVPYILHDRGGYFWNYHRTDFDCLEGHLKLVQVVGLPESDYDYTYVLDFIGFLLRTSRVLEKVVVTLEGGGKYLEDEVSEILLSFPRRSANAVVEVLGSQ